MSLVHANIDADIFTYSFGACTDDFGHPLAWPLVATRLNAQIRNIREAVGATSYTLYLTGEGNFRVRVATIKPYMIIPTSLLVGISAIHSVVIT